MQFDKEIKISIVNAISLKEQFSDIIEALLDSQTENEFVKELPIVCNTPRISNQGFS